MKVSVRARAVFALVFLPIPTLVLGGGTTLEDVLAEHCRARASVTTLKAGFEQTKSFALFDEEERSRGVFYYEQPDRLCWQYSDPDRSRTVISGKLGWSVFPDIKQVQKFNLAGSKTNKVLSIVGFGSCDAPLTGSFDIELATAREGSLMLLMVPTDEDIRPYFSRIELTLDGDDYLPRAIVLHETSGDILTFRFSNLEQDVSVENGLFDFSVPEGYEIVEY